jgi:hypothetical protein
MAQEFKVYWKRPRRAQGFPEQNVYPATPAEYYTGYFPGSKAVTESRSSFDIKRQELPEFNAWPVEVTEVPVTAWLTQFEPTKNLTNRRIPEVLEKPWTPNYGFYPAFKERPANQSVFDIRSLEVPEHLVYPATPPVPEQPLTAFIPPPYFYRPGQRALRKVLEINEYPETDVRIWQEVTGNDAIWYCQNPEETTWDSNATFWDLDGNVYKSLWDNIDNTWSEEAGTTVTWTEV